MFDRDNNGFITKDELKTAMEMIGENVTENQLTEMLALADLDKDGRINYEGNYHLNDQGFRNESIKRCVLIVMVSDSGMSLHALSPHFRIAVSISKP